MRVLAATEPTPTEIERIAREVLSRRQYVGREAVDFDNPILRAIDAFFRWLGDIFGDLGGSAVSAPTSLDPTRSGFGIAILIGLVALAVLVGSRLDRARQRSAVTRVPPVDPETDLTADQLEMAARQAADVGDFETAVRHLFVAGLLRLDEQGKITYDVSTPTSSLRRTLTDDIFEALAADFERVTYSDVLATGRDVESAQHDWSILLERNPAP